MLLVAQAAQVSRGFIVTWDDGSTVHTVFQDQIDGAAGTAQTTIVGSWSATTNYINDDLSASGGPQAAASGSTYIERYRGVSSVSGVA